MLTFFFLKFPFEGTQRCIWMLMVWEHLWPVSETHVKSHQFYCPMVIIWCEMACHMTRGACIRCHQLFCVQEDLYVKSSPISAWEHCRIGMPTSSEEVIREVCLAVSCWRALSGHQTYYSSYTGGQAQETNTPFRPYGSMATSGKCVSLGSVNRGMRLQDPVWYLSSLFQ